METKQLAHESGALTECPEWESHKRGKNWCAKIKIDPSAPGGLGRDFIQRARGEYYYLIDAIQPGDALEFGGDYYSTSGKKYQRRTYCRVVEITPTHLVVKLFDSGKEAIKNAE